jgi:hypothetical protein
MIVAQKPERRESFTGKRRRGDQAAVKLAAAMGNAIAIPMLVVDS